MSGSAIPLTDKEREKSLKLRLQQLFPDSLAQIDRCFEQPVDATATLPTPSQPKGAVPMRVYFKSSVAAASSYNTVGVNANTTAREVVKLLAAKNKFAALESRFALVLWKRSPDGVIDEQYLRDTERPANLIALWKSKGENDSSRRFYLYFAESIAAGLPRPEPFVPLDASAGSTAPDDDVHDDVAGEGDDAAGDDVLSPRAALRSLKRNLSKFSSLRSRGKQSGSGSGAKSPRDGEELSPREAAAKSPPRALSPALPPKQSPTTAVAAPAAAAANSAAANSSTTASTSTTTQQLSKLARTLTEAASLKTAVESPYRTIPSDLWADGDEKDLVERVASTPAPLTTAAAPSPSNDMKYLEQLLSEPTAGGVEDMRALSPRSDDDDDGFRMSLIDRPSGVFLDSVKLAAGAGATKHAVGAVSVAPAAAAKTPMGDPQNADEFAAAWLKSAVPADRNSRHSVDRLVGAVSTSKEEHSVREHKANTALAAIDDMLMGLDDDAAAGGGASANLELQAISAPAEEDIDDEPAYNQIPKGLSRPSFLKPAGVDEPVFTAKIAAIHRASAIKPAPVETEPALDARNDGGIDADKIGNTMDDLMKELAEPIDTSQAPNKPTSTLDRIDDINEWASLEKGTVSDLKQETAAAAVSSAVQVDIDAIDTGTWDFEMELQKAQEELASDLAHLND